MTTTEETARMVAHNAGTRYALTADEATEALRGWDARQAARVLAFAEGMGLVLDGLLVERIDAMWEAQRGVESIVLGVRRWYRLAGCPWFSDAVCEAIRWDWAYRIAGRRRDAGHERLCASQLGDVDSVVKLAVVAAYRNAVAWCDALPPGGAEVAAEFARRVEGWLSAISGGACCGVMPASAPIFMEGGLPRRVCIAAEVTT